MCARCVYFALAPPLQTANSSLDFGQNRDLSQVNGAAIAPATPAAVGVSPPWPASPLSSPTTTGGPFRTAQSFAPTVTAQLSPSRQSLSAQSPSLSTPSPSALAQQRAVQARGGGVAGGGEGGAAGWQMPPAVGVSGLDTQQVSEVIFVGEFVQPKLGE